MSRILIAEINKAVNNNRMYLVLLNSIKIKKCILTILHSQGFIQGFELRGKYIVVHLTQHYWTNWGIPTKSIMAISELKLSRTGTVSALKWKNINHTWGNAYCNIASTDKGIVNNNLHIATGGIPLLKIL